MQYISDEFFGRPNQPTIFVSSRMNGTLTEERKHAAEAIEGKAGARAWLWERDAEAGPYCSRDECIRRAQNSDGLVLIVAGDLSDIVYSEYLAATNAGAPTFIFIKEKVSLSADVQNFISQERLHTVTVEFGSLRQLKQRVRAAIIQYSSLAWRSAQQDERVRQADLKRRTAWQLNEKALMLAARGQGEEATSAWEEMASLGAELSDDFITSTAKHNFGTQARLAGAPEEARGIYLETLRDKLAIGDYLAVLQLLLNLATLTEDEAGPQEAQRQLVALEKVVRTVGEPGLLASLYGNLGRLAARRRNFSTAGKYFIRSLYYARKSKDAAHIVTCMRNLGLLRFEETRIPRAVGWFRQAVTVSEHHDLIVQAKASHRHLAATLQAAGRTREAIEELKQVHRQACQTSDDLDASVARYELGMLEAQVGEADSGRAHLEEAAGSFRELNERQWQQRTLRGLLELDGLRRDPEAVKGHLDELLTQTPLRDRPTRADGLKAAALALLASGSNRRRARGYYDRALRAMESYLEEGGFAWQLVLAGAAFSQYGAAELALPFFDRALRIYEGAEDLPMICHALNDRGNAFMRLERHPDARQDFQRCLELAIQIEDTGHQLKARLNMGEEARRSGNLTEASALLSQVVSQSEALGDDTLRTLALGNLGLTRINAEDLEGASEAFRVMLEVASRSKDQSREAEAVLQLGWIDSKMHHFGRARRNYMQALQLYRAIQDEEGAKEALASLLQVESARGRPDETQVFAQELADVAARSGGYTVWQRTSAAALYWARRGQIPACATLFSMAVLFSLDREMDGPEDLQRALLEPFMYVLLGLKQDGEGQRDEITDMVVAEVVQRTPLNEDFVREAVQQAERTVGQLPGPE